MEMRFAGSARLDDRRRRRLATEADSVWDEVTAGDVPGCERGPAAEDSSAGEWDESQAGDFDEETIALPSSAGTTRTVHRPSRRGSRGAASATPKATETPWSELLPVALWKYVTAYSAIVVLAALIMTAECFASRWAPFLGPGYARWFEVGAGRVTTWFTQVLLLVSAQTAAIIGWVRSRSENDFAGRYRLWTKVALGWLVWHLGVTSGAHLACSETILWLWPRDFWQNQTLCWMVPALLTGMAGVVCLHREMRGCRASLTALQVGAVLVLAAAALQLELLPFPEGWRGDLLTRAVTLAAQLTLFLSLLLHLRHVVFVCLDPVEIPRRTFSLPRPHFRWLSLLKFRRKPAADDSEGDDEEESGTKKRRKTSTRRKPTKRKSSSKTTTRTRRKPAPEQEDDEDDIEEAGEEASDEEREVDAEAEDDGDAEVAELDEFAATSEESDESEDDERESATRGDADDEPEPFGDQDDEENERSSAKQADLPMQKSRIRLDSRQMLSGHEPPARSGLNPLGRSSGLGSNSPASSQVDEEEEDTTSGRLGRGTGSLGAPSKLPPPPLKGGASLGQAPSPLGSSSTSGGRSSPLTGSQGTASYADAAELTEPPETESHEDNGDEVTDADGNRISLKGLSKKQRRRVMQEIRDRERQNRR